MNENIEISVIDRRDFVRLAAGAAGLAAAAGLGLTMNAGAAMIEPPPLPWAENALEPHISARTIGFHYGKHHAAYVKNTAAMVRGTSLEGKPLPEVVKAAMAMDGALYNNAAQAWNHAFYWQCLKPGGGGRPSGKLLRMIETSFGSFEACTDKLKKEAGRFGSAWAWLVADRGALRAMSTPNADTPLAHGLTPVLTIDVWEHAYYLDYQNRRSDYVDAVLTHLVNWDFAAGNL